MDEITGEQSNAGAPQVATTPPPLPETAEQFKCKTCGREFDSAIALQTHTIRAHKKFWSTFSPGDPRATKARAKGRRKRKHTRFNLETACPLCHNEFKNKQTLGAHIRHVHGRSASDFPELGFSDRGTGRKFRATTTTPAEKAKRREYYRTYTNRLHAQGLSSKGEPYKRKPGRAGRKKDPNLGKECPICHRSYSTRAIMGHHMRTQHGKSLSEFRNGAEAAPAPAMPEARHVCPVCSHTFKRRAYLAIHTREVHGKSITELEHGEPSEAPAPKREPNAAADHHTRNVLFCPVCGTNIQNVQTAVNFGG